MIPTWTGRNQGDGPKTVISNVRAEYNQTLSGRSRITDGLLWRHLWLTAPGDFWATTHRPSTQYLSYVSDLTGLDLHSVTTQTTDGFAISDGVLRRLAATIDSDRAKPSGEICPALKTPGIAAFATDFGLKMPGLAFAFEGGYTLFNRKSTFRALATGLGLPIPRGQVCGSPQDLTEALHRYRDGELPLIIKADIGGGGVGNIVLRAAGNSNTMPGAGGIIQWQSGRDCSKASEAIVNQLGADAFPLVLEEYVEGAKPFYFEFNVEDDGSVSVHNEGVVNWTAHDATDTTEWGGLEWPLAALVPNAVVDSARHDAIRFIEMAARVGFRGYINIDAVYDERGRYWFNETNGRWGGGLVAVAARNRIQESSKKKFASARLLRVRLNAGFDACVQAATAKYGEKAIVLGAPFHGTGVVELLFLGDTKDDVDRTMDDVVESLEPLRV